MKNIVILSLHLTCSWCFKNISTDKMAADDRSLNPLHRKERRHCIFRKTFTLSTISIGIAIMIKGWLRSFNWNKFIVVLVRIESCCYGTSSSSDRTYSIVQFNHWNCWDGDIILRSRYSDIANAVDLMIFVGILLVGGAADAFVCIISRSAPLPLSARRTVRISTCVVWFISFRFMQFRCKIIKLCILYTRDCQWRNG